MASKKIFLIGGTGRTGLIFAEGMLAEGHSVTAVVRRPPAAPGTLAISGPIAGSGASGEVAAEAAADASAAHNMTVGPHEKLTLVVAEFTAESLEPLMASHDIVVVTLGMWPKEGETEISGYSDAAKAYVPAMRACGIKRFFTVFGLGFLGPEVKERFDGDSTIAIIQRDMRRVYDLVVAAELDYTIWCPGNFPSGPRSDKYITGENSRVGFEVTTGMVADSMIREVVAGAFVGVRVGIASA